MSNGYTTLRLRRLAIPILELDFIHIKLRDQRKRGHLKSMNAENDIDQRISSRGERLCLWSFPEDIDTTAPCPTRNGTAGTVCERSGDSIEREDGQCRECIEFGLCGTILTTIP